MGISPGEGVLLGRAIVTNGDFMEYACDATRPSSQITLGTLVTDSHVETTLVVAAKHDDESLLRRVMPLRRLGVLSTKSRIMRLMRQPAFPPYVLRVGGAGAPALMFYAYGLTFGARSMGQDAGWLAGLNGPRSPSTSTNPVRWIDRLATQSSLARSTC